MTNKNQNKKAETENKVVAPAPQQPISLRDRILSARDMKSEIIYVEEWDVKVEIRSLTGKTRAHLMSSAMSSNGKMDFEKLYPELIIATTYDPDTGNQVFNKSDREAINTKSGGALEKIAKVAMELSGLTEAAVDNAEKN